MSVILRLIYAPGAAVGLCSTCSWGTARKGFSASEAETFCRLVGPNARVRYAVRECTSYCDRREPSTVSEARRYGFGTEIKLTDDEGVRIAPGNGSKE